MSTVDMSGLPVATIANNSDVVLLRSGLTDYQCAVSLIRNINVESLSPIPFGSGDATDKFLLSRVVGGVPSNFNIRFSQVSFPKGTRMWFYNSVAPTSWSIVPNTGDQLLAVKGGSSYTSAGASQGTWQQTSVALTIQQIPNHQHFTRTGNNQSNSNANYLFAAKNPGGTDPLYNSTTSLGIIGGEGDSPTHDNYGQCQTHNHGDTWRPLANVGIICNKDE